jgi:hypothetical protein
VDPLKSNLRRYHKTAEIAANPKVELCYLDDHPNQVRITGLAETVTEAALLQEIWNSNPLLRQYLGRIDNPEFLGLPPAEVAQLLQGQTRLSTKSTAVRMPFACVSRFYYGAACRITWTRLIAKSINTCLPAFRPGQ